MARPSQLNQLRTYSCSAAWGDRLERTTDLGPIAGRKVLVLLDEQNLTIAARDHGYALPYNLLAKRIRRVTKTAELHIFIAAHQKDGRACKKLERSGYAVHVKTIRQKRFANGDRRCDSNIDNLFSFWAGLCVPNTACQVIVLGSGDYGLSGEIAQAICAQHRTDSVQIMTLSLPGSTSQDLDAYINRNVTANLEIGLDLMKPLPRLLCQIPAGSVAGSQKFRSGSSC